MRVETIRRIFKLLFLIRTSLSGRLLNISEENGCYDMEKNGCYDMEKNFVKLPQGILLNEHFVICSRRLQKEEQGSGRINLLQCLAKFPQGKMYL